MVLAWYLESTSDSESTMSAPDDDKLLDMETVTTNTGVRHYYVNVNIGTSSRCILFSGPTSVNTEANYVHRC